MNITIFNEDGTTLGTFRAVTPLSIESETRFFRGETLSLRTLTNSSAAQRWLVDITLEPGTAGNRLAALLAAHKARHGYHSSFSVTMPQQYYIEDSTSYTIAEVQVTSSFGTGTANLATNGSSFISYVGGEPGEPTDVMQVGQYLDFGSGKIHLVTEDLTNATADGLAINGKAARITPSLAATVPVNTSVNLSPNINVSYNESDDQSITYQDGLLSNISISLVEAV